MLGDCAWAHGDGEVVGEASHLLLSPSRTAQAAPGSFLSMQFEGARWWGWGWWPRSLQVTVVAAPPGSVQQRGVASLEGFAANCHLQLCQVSQGL